MKKLDASIATIHLQSVLTREKQSPRPVGHKWRNVEVCWCGWQTVGSAPDEKSVSQRREQARRVYYGAVFEAKKEIPGLLVA
jgi:hypothetical protein